MIYSQLLESKSINKLETWMKYTEIPYLLGFDEVSVNSFMNHYLISTMKILKINNKMFPIFNKYENISDAAIIDVTDTYFAGSNINIKKRKERKG